MADDPEDGDHAIDIEIPGPDGKPVSVRGRLVDGPNPCPFCPGEFTVFETWDGHGLVAHPSPVCGGFTSSDAEAYVRSAQEAAEGVNSSGRGAA